MESYPVVFDISSDDDEAALAWEEPKGDDYDWLSEVLQAVDKGFDDPDEVVVVGEVNPIRKSKSSNSSIRKVVDEDDDDCVVLECDPDKALSDVNDPREDSDELLIVGQKGQCHCFVCDTRAPCRFWGSDSCNTDHCHATDKEQMWKALRKNFRLVGNVPIEVANAPVTSHSTALPQLNQDPSCDIIWSTMQNQVSGLTPTRAARNCIPQNHVPKPSIIRACSSSSRYGNPYNPSLGSRPVLNKSIMQPRSVSQQLLGVHNTVIRRDRGIKISNLGSQFVSSNTMSKRLEIQVTSAMNHAAYMPSENITFVHASQNQQNPAPVAISNERNSNPIGWPNICSGTNLGTYTHQSSSQPSMDSVITNSAPTQSSAYNQPVPQSNVHQAANHLQFQNQPATDYGFSDYDFNLVNIGQNNQQSFVDYLQLQTAGSTNEKEQLKEVNDGDKSYYNDLESFLFDDQSVPEGSFTAELNPMFAW
ncbi:uncharacterized protein LOC111305356 isoform X2 [Durio zibethinus]|uniref:Uncharacterized protein LOC111305356 isoform X2 n=1 Tax=Durio zibethinus TaxID=66656 RepID=A0A6P6A0P6_DURZI|nr:uncharacterized protein LOC111305356 isoform X2 [Durio zibethinus]